MCLERLSHFEVTLDKDGIGTGWQTFNLFEGQLMPLFRSECYVNSIPVNCWEKDPNNFRLKTDKSSISYTTGFHIFLDYSSALKYSSLCCENCSGSIQQVFFRKVVVKGLEGKKKIVVARERYIVEN